MLRDLVMQNRSYRRFHQDVAITEETLKELVDLARNSASASNRQALKYIISSDPEKNAKIFPLLGFAAQYREWPGPAEGERPAAYIVILLDTEIAKGAGCDHGIAAQSILLGATEKGLGGCMHGSVKKDEFREAFALDERYEILLAISLGEPGEKEILEAMGPDGDTKYWRDEGQGHHVPKRSLDELIIS